MQIFDDKKKRIGTLSGFKDRAITTTLDSGDKELTFDYPASGALVALLKEEYYIRTKTDEFVLKAVEKGEQFNKYTAVLNVEELEGTAFPYGFESDEQTIKACLEFAFEGTGWHVGTCTVTKKRTIDEQESVTAWDVLQKCLTTYRCECIIHSLTKTIDIYDRIGSDRGCYFMEGLNLRKISLKSDTYDFYTRIYPIGKDGITPEWLTGKDYIDNFQYSSKIKAYVWKDERYTNTTSLIEDATAKIEEMSRPYKAYTAEVVDLAKASEKYKDILSYGIGDTVTLVSKKTRTKEKQRIVKITEYPETPEKNTVEISNARKTFAEIQKEETAAATEEAISISNRATKKVLENYSTTEEIETKITASKKAVEAGVAYTLKNYYTSVQMDSLIKATKEEISQEVKHVEENSMHNYVVNGDFSNGLDDNWYNSNETNNSVMDVSGLGTVAKILKTSSSSSYIRQNLGKIPAGTYRVRYKAATAAGYESTARVQVGALGSYSTTSSGMLKSKELTTIEREITVSEGTKYIYIYAYTQNAPVYITDIEILGLYSLYADAKIQVTAEEITSEVNKKVNSDDFGTLITQNAYNVRIAFNKGSSYMQFDSTGITMYTGTITDNTKMIASMAKAAAVNNKIGYDQSERYTFLEHLKASNYDPAQITIACEADCSSGVAAIVKGAGYRLGNEKMKNVSIYLYTGNMRAGLKAAGFEVLTDSKYLTSDAYLLEGDITLNDNAHVAVNLTDGAKSSGTGASNTTTVKSNAKVDVAHGFNKSLAGTYKVTASGLNLRAGAGTVKSILAVMKNGEKVQCYGYYNDCNGVKWLYVVYKNIVGYASSKYLSK